MGGFVVPSQRKNRPAASRAEAFCELVERQHGVISRAQMRSLGYSDGAVDAWVRTRRLHRRFRGVYAVGHARLTREGHWMAAVLACGPGAVLSHRDAAGLWGIRPTARTRIDVTAPRTRVRVAGIDIHRSRRLDEDEVTVVDGIPSTTLARTFVDLAAVVNERQLVRALNQADVLNLLDGDEIAAALAKASGRRGVGKLRRALGTETDRTRSELERRFLRLCRRAGVPPPVVNGTVAGLEVDFLWRDRRLVVEVDSWTFHRTRGAFERDRARDQLLAREGMRVVRFTDRQIETGAGEVVVTLSDLFR